MKQRSKLSPQHLEQQSTGQETRQQAAAREFATAEELLRFDAAQTTVPPQIADRLKASVPPPPPRSWWRNLFGGA